MRILLIALFGAVGTLARYGLQGIIQTRAGGTFPHGTLVVNLTACVIIGFALTFLSRRVEIDPAWRYFATIGFIGAYSTFSTYEWETLSTMRSGAFLLGAVYAVGSLVLGLAATWCGTALADLL